MTTNNKISMTTGTFIDLLPFRLENDASTRYLANLNSFKATNINGKYPLWQHMEALKQSISSMFDGLNETQMTEKVFLQSINLSAFESVQKHLTRRLNQFKEEFLANEDTFKPWQLILAFAVVVENFVLETLEEIGIYAIN